MQSSLPGTQFIPAINAGVFSGSFMNEEMKKMKKLCQLMFVFLILSVVFPSHAAVIHGFLASPAGEHYDYVTIDFPGGDWPTYASGINDAGQVAGCYSVDSGFLLNGGSFTTIHFPGHFMSVDGVNNIGQIVGWGADTNGQHGYHLDASTLTKLDYPNAEETWASGINDEGKIVGGTYAPSTGYHGGFLLDGGSYTAIDFPGADHSVACGINNSGQIVGYYEYKDGPPNAQGFFFDKGSYTTINITGASLLRATDINDAGDIVGYCVDSVDSQCYGFLTDCNGYTQIAFPGASKTKVLGINNAGQMVGWYVAPIPLPSTMWLFSSSLIVLAGIRRKFRKA